MSSKDSFKVLSQLQVKGKTYDYYSLKKAAKQIGEINNLPKSLKVLLENLLRFEDDITVNSQDIKALSSWLEKRSIDHEIQYRPTRVLMQDFTGVPAVVDLAAMREAMREAGANPDIINPLSPVDLVIDHSVMVDHFGDNTVFQFNVDKEMERNAERYKFLRWGQMAFDNFKVVPPGTGICHQVNLEYLGQSVWTKEEDGKTWAFPDTLVGTDSHTTMINGLGVLGWGVGGIEAEAAMLGQPISMLIPDVIGFELKGQLKEGITATDLVLTVTEMLRAKGVVGKFVEYYGDGLAELPLADRATIANMAPEYGATCGFFPIDDVTLDYLRLTGRDPERIALVEAYAKEQGFWRFDGDKPKFTDTLTLDISQVEPSLAGPKRPQDRVALKNVPTAFNQIIGKEVAATDEEASHLQDEGGQTAIGVTQADFERDQDMPFCQINGEEHPLREGSVVIAAITSCTNTSNPEVMIAAGILAKKAIEKGLQQQPWVKTSLSPGSKVVTDYLEAAELDGYLNELGFNLVGYGCTTCIGNSGPLVSVVEEAILKHDLTVASVLSGNRNFEGRIHPLIKTNWLASPPLVVAYALAGNIRIDFDKNPLGFDQEGKPVYLKDVWPSKAEIAEAFAKLSSEMFHDEYDGVFEGNELWQNIPVAKGQTYTWQDDSTYIRHPSFFTGIHKREDRVDPIENARILALLGDSVTTDHISPAGAIKKESPAGKYLGEHGVATEDFNSYGSRRGNHEVMMRGTFANVRIKNEMLDGVEGGYTRYIPDGSQMSIYDAAMRYQATGTNLMVIAGKEYGTGSSRDWAAKGTNLLGVKAVLAESFERIHRSNLVGMGILPLQFLAGRNRKSLALKGDEVISVLGLKSDIKPQIQLQIKVVRVDGSEIIEDVLCRIDTLNEIAYYKAGGILHYVLKNLLREAK